MHIRSGLTFLLFILGMALFALPTKSAAQGRIPAGIEPAGEQLPNAPVPHVEIAENTAGSEPASAAGAAGQSRSGAQTASDQAGSVEGDHDKAADQIKAQEQQRVLGIVPTFNITYLGDATVSITAKQKFALALHSSVDPVAFAIPFFVAGYHEARDDNKGFPWGVKGLGERAGAAYLDALDGNMIGNAILPAILHQDPRYYRMGHGSAGRRLMYSLATSFICKHDNTGRWEPNYSNVAGNIAGGALSNLYYPANDSGAGLTISNGFIVTAEGALGSVFDEFWPDISRRILHKDPTHGLDAQLKAADEAKKKAVQGN